MNTAVQPWPAGARRPQLAARSSLWFVTVFSALLVHLVLLTALPGIVRPPAPAAVAADRILQVRLLEPAVESPPVAADATGAESPAPAVRSAVTGQRRRLGPLPSQTASQEHSWAPPAEAPDSLKAADGQIPPDSRRQPSEQDGDKALLARVSKQIAQVLQRVWKVPPGAPVASRARVRLELSRTGRIQRIELMEISGNESFDASVQRAVGAMGRLTLVEKLPQELYLQYFRHLELVFDADRRRRI